jgi:hypothetical protein
MIQVTSLSDCHPDILRAQDIMLPPSTPSQDAAVRSSKHLIGDRPVVSPGSSTLKPKVTTESSDINDVDEEIRILRVSNIDLPRSLAHHLMCRRN